MSLKNQDATRRKIFRDNNFGVRTFGIKALRYSNLGIIHKSGREALDNLGIARDLVGRYFDASAENEFGSRTTELDWADCEQTSINTRQEKYAIPRTY
jgi:hypothetical protein